MKLDIAVVNYNTDSFLYNLLRSIREVLPAEAVSRVHVWDNGSSDASVPMLEAFAASAPWLSVHRSPINLYHGPALDRLLREHCDGPWVLVLDSDTEVRRNFLPDLPPLEPDSPVFVGQITPTANQFYAYPFYLLVNRAWYLELPAFSHDGAPGLALFRDVAERGLPYRRFRWSDYVEHFGQGSLRGIYERGERTNAFFDFAARESQARPKSEARVTLEQRLCHQLQQFLVERAVATPAAAPPHPGVTVERVTSAPRHPGRGLREAVVRIPGVRACRRFLTPRLTLALREAYDVGMTQKTAEIRALAGMVRVLRPRRVLEIGTSYGGTFYLWTRLAAADALLISLDLPPWELDDPFEADKLRVFRGFRRARQHLHFLRADSHLEGTRREVEALLGGARLDLLFIDGDHAYDGVRRDFEEYGALVRPGGLVAFHDIHPHSKGWGGDVPRFWAEIRESWAGRELIEDRAQDGFGVGVIRVPG